MKVAFIDTLLRVNKLEINSPVMEINLVDERIDGDNDSHSAICIKIFEENVKKIHECEVLCIAVMDGFNKGNVKEIMEALDWCIVNKVDVINLSIGTTDEKDGKLIAEKLHEVISYGIKVIAAVSNKGERTYPANCAGVYGVKHNLRCMVKGTQIMDKKGGGAMVSICAPKSIRAKEGRYELVFSNSYATALYTAVVVNETLELNI